MSDYGDQLARDALAQLNAHAGDAVHEHLYGTTAKLQLFPPDLGPSSPTEALAAMYKQIGLAENIKQALNWPSDVHLVAGDHVSDFIGRLGGPPATDDQLRDLAGMLDWVEEPCRQGS